VEGLERWLPTLDSGMEERIGELLGGWLEGDDWVSGRMDG
jgi:hypothetical protein